MKQLAHILLRQVTLQTSVAILGTVVFHAKYAREPFYAVIMSVITMFSMLCTVSDQFADADFVARCTAILYVIALETPKAISTGNQWLLLFPTAVVALWHVRHQHFTLLAAVNVIAATGMHSYLSCLY